MASTAPSRVCGRSFLTYAWELPAPRAPQAPEETGGDRLPGAPRLALPVPHRATSGPAAPEPAGVYAGPTVAPLHQPRHHHGRASQWRARATLVAGQEGGLVRRPCRLPDAGDEHAVRPGPSRHRADIIRQARLHHPGGSQQAFLMGLAHLYNLIPYQRRAQHAGHCGVEVEGGCVLTSDWFLNLQIHTSGGFR
jgi:hypothetical protein